MKPEEWGALPWNSGVQIAASGEEWVVVNNPPGLRSHPNRDGLDPKSVLQCAWKADQQFYDLGKEMGSKLILCHRLDAPTSGVLLLALSALAPAILSAFRQNQVRKVYYGLIVGRVRRKEFIWKSRLLREKNEGRLRVRSGSGGEWAETKGREIAVRKETPILSLLQLEPLTGRTHQLRAQAAENGVPILGDRNYGNFAANRTLKQQGTESRLYLHAASIELQTKRSGRITAQAKCPFAFSQLGLEW